VVNELLRQSCVIDEPLVFSHFRDRSGVEVALIIEPAEGTVVCIEVKSARSTTPVDAKGLRFLRDCLGDRFSCGVINALPAD